MELFMDLNRNCSSHNLQNAANSNTEYLYQNDRTSYGDDHTFDFRPLDGLYRSSSVLE